MIALRLSQYRAVLEGPRPISDRNRQERRANRRDIKDPTLVVGFKFQSQDMIRWELAESPVFSALPADATEVYRWVFVPTQASQTKCANAPCAILTLFVSARIFLEVSPIIAGRICSQESGATHARTHRV